MIYRIFNSPWVHAILLVLVFGVLTPNLARAETRIVGSIDYSWNTFGKNDQIVVTVVNDPKVDGVLCYWSAARKGGISGGLGLATDPAEASLACRQVGPVSFRDKFKKNENIAKTSQNWSGFQTMQVVRMCDTAANVLIYTVYTDKLIDGFPRSSLSVVPIFPMNGKDAPRCADWIK